MGKSHKARKAGVRRAIENKRIIKQELGKHKKKQQRPNSFAQVAVSSQRVVVKKRRQSDGELPAERIFTSAIETSTATTTAVMSNILAMDCEYVGVGYNGAENALARVSIVNEVGKCVFDRYVRTDEPVTDYRTEVSGIRPGHLINGDDYRNIQQQVGKLIAGKIVVGHGLHNDFKVLGLTHPARLIRDTARYKALRLMTNGGAHRMPKLKELAHHLLGVQIQQGEHDSITDARTALRIYQLHRKKWEKEFKQLLHEVAFRKTKKRKV